MFDHLTLRASNPAASERFYETVLRALGASEPNRESDEFTQWGDVSVAPARANRPVTRRLHVGFGAASREQVDAFSQAGIDAGFESDGTPGPRPQYLEDYYSGFLLDPDGNSAEAVHHSGVSAPGTIDHLWIRVADLAAAKGFYAAIAPHARYRADADTPERVSFTNAAGRSFSLVEGDPTQGLHLAFAAADPAAVDAFHAALTSAGHRDNGAPGPRPEYHAGYYGAFVRDPDESNIELVHHRRP